MTRGRLVIAACVIVVLAFAFTQYVHRGYVGVTDVNGKISILQPGPHFRPPWVLVSFYPVRTAEITVQTTSTGSRGTCKFDLSLYMSIMPDSVRSLHEAYRGKYIESCITPLVADFLLRRGSVVDGWSSEAEKVGKDLVAYLNTAVNPRGIFVYSASLRTYEVQTDLGKTLR